MTSVSSETSDDGLRSSGMRDMGPDEMARFRRVERAFLDVCERSKYREIRTPALEPLHLYTATGSLSPQLLDGVYSFLDWDGWSGERVVLRPDSTVPAARWYEEQQNGGGAARLCYVQPVYRFDPTGDREIWQCGVELFGIEAPEADIELLTLARDFLLELGFDDVRYEIAHAGLVRAVLAAAGLDQTAQVAAYDRLLAGDDAVIDELVGANPDGASAVRLLFDVDGSTSAYLANLRAALPGNAEAKLALDELEAAINALQQAGSVALVRPSAAGSFEYYSGLTFVVSADDQPLVTGGRYDHLTGSLGDRQAPASGFAANLLRIAELVADR
jgi:histidyl-tRNA synthetase